MKRKLTKRERFLCILAGTLLICYGLVYFAFIPAYDRLQESVNQRDSLRLEQSAMERAVTILPQTEESYQSLLQSITLQSEQFYDAPDNTNVDILMTGICLSHGLKPKVLSIASAREPVPLPAGEEGEAAFIDEETGEPISNPHNAVSTVLVTLDLAGNFENVKAVTAQLLDTSYARVASLSYDERGKSANLVVEVFLQDDFGL